MHRTFLRALSAVALCGFFSHCSGSRTDFSDIKSPEQFDAYIRTHAPDEMAFVAMQRAAASAVRARQWSEAAAVYEAYRPLFPSMTTRFAKIIAMLGVKEAGLIVTNVGPGVNTNQDDYTPVPTADGALMYFTRSKLGPGVDENVFVSERRDSVWRSARPLGSSINTRLSECVTSVSSDGTRIFLFGNYIGGLGWGDMFYSEKNQSGWDFPRCFPRPINSADFESGGMIAGDGKALLFNSSRPGNIGEFHSKMLPDDNSFHGDHFGNQDIYVCLSRGDTWSDPINLGPHINTPYCEYAPFLHPDGKTLYFSSDGH
jgi:hypothetical protein